MSPSLQDAAARTRALLARMDPVGYERTYRLFARSDEAHSGRLARLSLPALLLTGEHDPNSTPAMSEAMARVTPGGRAIVLSNAKHMMALTDADRTNRVLRDFVDAAEGAPV